jgi:hypothetical protein
MAEVTAFRNNALPYPVYGVPWVVTFPLLDADGDPVTGATCDSEVSLNGDTAADCTNEGVEIPYTTATNKGMYYLILTGTEMTADCVAITIYSATSKATPIVLYPRKLVSLATGTSQGGAAGYITLAANAVAYNNQYNGCLCVAVIDTLTEARVLQVCTASNQQCTVTPNWNVTPDSDDTYTIYLPEGRQIPTVDILSWNGTTVHTPTLAGVPYVDIHNWLGAAAPAMTGDAYARLGAPAGASVSADIAAVKIDTAATLADTGTTGVIISETDPVMLDIHTDIGALAEKASVPKNSALANFSFPMTWQGTHLPATSKTVTAQISKDGGAFANCSGSVSEISGGVYKISLTQTEMNADVVTLKFTADACDTRIVTIKTES